MGRGGREGSKELRRLEGDAVRGGGDASGVGHRRNRTERLVRLSVCDGLAIGGVHADKVLILRVAHLEYTVLGRVGANIIDTNTIEAVVAVARSVGIFGIASLEARNIVANETDQAR